MRLLQNRKKNLPSSWGDVTPSSLWPLRTSIVTGGGGEGCWGESKSEKERKVSTWLEFPWFAMQEGKQVSAINSAHCPPRKASQVPPFGFKSVSFCAPCAELITTVLCLIAAKGRDAFKKSFWSHKHPRVHFESYTPFLSRSPAFSFYWVAQLCKDNKQGCRFNAVLVEEVE